MPEFLLDLNENLRNLAVCLKISADSGDQALGIMRFLGSWQGMMFIWEWNSSPILQMLWHVRVFPHFPQCKVFVCRKWLRERERLIPDTTLMIKSLTFWPNQAKWASEPKAPYLLISCCFLTPLYLFLFVSFWPEVNPELKNKPKNVPPPTQWSTHEHHLSYPWNRNSFII